MKNQIKNALIVIGLVGWAFAFLYRAEYKIQSAAVVELEEQTHENAVRIGRLERVQRKLISSYTFTGLASYYGTFEIGRPTSTGETFDPEAMTIAGLKHFPKDTWWVIRRRDNGAIVSARMNDTLPSKWGRLVDLSVGVARVFGTMERGIVDVTICPDLAAIEANLETPQMPFSVANVAPPSTLTPALGQKSPKKPYTN